MPRRSFDKPFKISAVKLIVEEGFSVKEVSRELSVHANSLYRWVQEVEKYGENAFPGKGALFLYVLKTTCYAGGSLELQARYKKRLLKC